MTTAQKEYLRLQSDFEAYERGEIPWQTDGGKSKYILENDEWKYDQIPEIMDGMNIADYVDPDIEKKLEALEKEEEEQLLTAALELDDTMVLSPEDQKIYDEIVNAQKILRKVSATKKGDEGNRIELKTRGRTRAQLQEHLEELGYSSDVAQEKAKEVKSRSRSRTVSVKRGREVPFMEGSKDKVRSRSNSLIRKGEEVAMATQVNENKAKLTVAEYCPDIRNAKLLAFGGRGSNILYIAQVEYAFPYLS